MFHGAVSRLIHRGGLAAAMIQSGSSCTWPAERVPVRVGKESQSARGRAASGSGCNDLPRGSPGAASAAARPTRRWLTFCPSSDEKAWRLRNVERRERIRRRGGGRFPRREPARVDDHDRDEPRDRRDGVAAREGIIVPKPRNRDEERGRRGQKVQTDQGSDDPGSAPNQQQFSAPRRPARLPSREGRNVCPYKAIPRLPQGFGTRPRVCVAANSRPNPGFRARRSDPRRSAAHHATTGGRTTPTQSGRH